MALSSPPVLGYPIFGQQFIVHTDASGIGLGTVLYQEQDGKKTVISFVRRSLTKAEKNYSTFKLKFLAVKWAIREKICDYLLSSTFVVIRDNNHLTYILSSA